MLKKSTLFTTFLSCVFLSHSEADITSPDISFTHAIALHGEPRHGTDMKHFEYVNPDAPKGGTLRVSQIGTYDTFNLYGPQGKAPFGLFFIHETLLTRSWGEPLTKYGVISKSIERPTDNTWVAFHINPDAKFHDGKEITAADVVFSFKALTEQGSLFWRQFYQDIASVEATTKYRVLFTFKHNRNKELPLLLGQLPVLASHWWKGRDFSVTTLDIPVGSGPYRISRFQPGRFIEYERVRNYWGSKHPVNVGRFNFDTIRYDFYRDTHIAMEAMNSGQMDWRLESDPRYWADGYSKNALEKGRLIKRTWKNHNPQTQALVINSRREPLQDIRIREALATLLDVNWVLDNLLNGAMVKANSLFAGTEMAASGLPDGDELKFLQQNEDTLPDRLFTQSWPPASNLEHRDRLKYALSLFDQAGFKLKNSMMTSPTGKPVILELLLGDPSLERLLQSQVRRFAEAGIKLQIRTVDSARYLKHIRALDFDLIVHTFRHTPAPGTEQRSLWGSAEHNEPGTLNLAGVNNPVIDKLTATIPEATSRAELVSLIRALDRTLLWQFKAIPLLYNPNWQVIYSDRIQPPENMSLYTVERTTWWSVPSKLSKKETQRHNK